MPDGQDYFHTQFEAFHAHKVFPCFDQPDLKARYKFICFSPAEWVVVSNEPVETICRVGESNFGSHMAALGIPSVLVDPPGCADPPTMHIFGQTPLPFSPYLFAIAVGNFVRFQSELPLVLGKRNIPIGAYIRPEHAVKFAAGQQEFFRLTAAAIAFFSEYLDFPYPYTKYDQVFVPDFRYGGMENVGCVIFAEQFGLSGATSASSFYILSHELSHHWFGDTVTARWWNNLWMNEGFATLMGHLCMAKAPGLEKFRPEAWVIFHKMKARAYGREGLYNHPIITELNTTENAEALIDCITYDKSGSVIKQLMYILGEEGFRDALRQYIARFKFSNVQPEDLLAVLEEFAAKRGRKQYFDKDNWAAEWLFSPGNNELQPFFETKGDKIAWFNIQQKPDSAGLYRTHLIRIALFYGKECKYVDDVVVQPAEMTQVKALEGLPAPVAVYLNADDHAYVRVKMDPVSEAVLQSGGVVPEGITGTMMTISANSSQFFNL